LIFKVLMMLVTVQNPPETVQNARGPASRDVWDLVRWTYGEQRAHQVLGLKGKWVPDELVTAGRAAGFRVAEVVELLGVMPDCWNSGCDGTGIHPEAVAVHEAVLALGDLHRGVLLEFGITGRAPDPADVPVEMLPVLDDAGRPVMIRDPRSRRTIACAVEPTVDQRDVDWARRVYGWWHAGLVALAEVLVSRNIEVLGPKALARPWNSPIDAARIF
jgi:hypothetical protein